MVQKKSVSKKTASKKKVSKKSTVKKAVTKKKAVVKKKTVTKKKVASKKKASAGKAPAVIYITNEERYKMVAEAAYHLSEQQGFEPGKDMDNWLIAELQIEPEMKKKNISIK